MENPKMFETTNQMSMRDTCFRKHTRTQLFLGKLLMGLDCNFPTVGAKRAKWGEETPAEEDKKHLVKAAKMDI